MAGVQVESTVHWTQNAKDAGTKQSSAFQGIRKEDQGLLHSGANQYNPHSMMFRSEVTRTILGVQKDLDMHIPLPTLHLHLYNRTPGEENAQDQGVQVGSMTAQVPAEPQLYLQSR